MSEHRALPLIDVHAKRIDADAPDVWAGLGRMLAGTQRPTMAPTVRLVGARPSRAAGNPLRTGSAIPGFAVVRAESPRELVLEGPRTAVYR